MKNFNLTLGIVEPLKIEPFEIVSQDLNGNKLNINLVIDGSLIPYNLTRTTVILYFKRDDGVRLQQYATITNAIQGQIEIVLDTDIIATRGKVFAEVAVYAGEEMKCTSQLFGFQVRKNINDSETVVSGNDLPNYRQEMQRLETILDNLILSAGDSNPEIVAARYSMLENKTFTTLGDRLDFIEEKARQNVTDLETSITAVADDLAAHKADYAKEATQFDMTFNIEVTASSKGIYWKKNGVVFFTINCAKTSGGYGYDELLTTLPVGFRPKINIYMTGFTGVGSSADARLSCTVTADGSIKTRNTTTQSVLSISGSFYAGGGTQ